jgi:hypothetical protein
MLGNSHFYNRTIRKIVVAFGTIFNDIYVVRYTADGSTAKEKFKVPLNYGPKEKYLTVITSDPNLTKSINTVVPRISFEMTGISYDSSRKLPSTVQNFSASTTTGVKTQYAPIPYNFEFSLSLYARNHEDAAQILEQILPFFTPDFNVTVNLNPQMTQKYDLPIILNSVNPEIDYEGDLMTTRLIIWNLEFTAKSYIYPAVKDGKLIRQANTNLYLEASTPSETKKVFVDYANGTGTFSDTETIRVTGRDVFGKVVYFSNSNNGILVVENLNRPLEVGDVVVGDLSNATYTIETVSDEPIKTVIVITAPDPLNTLPNTAFGFSETITEYPDTL